MEKINSLEISDASKKVYSSILKRFVKHGFDIDKKITLKNVEKLINKVDKTSSKLDLLNLIIVIGEMPDKTMIELKQLRKELQHLRVENNIEKMNIKGDTLLKYDIFQQMLNDFYEKKKYKAYILNYLMVTYGLRNLDLDVIICHKKCDDIDDKKNYLIVSGQKVKYIRNVYKTSKKYGPKEHNIKGNEKLIEAIKKVPTGHILEQSNTIGNELRKLLIMKEADSFKMVIDHYYDLEDTKKINELSESRGTSIGTIRNFYNINAEKEIIREV
tara:strand:- start:1412 stop:2227 length:816 start_codon:yes stop_codon:yes gene_type:complete